MASAYAEAQLRLFVEHTPAAVAMFDREMRYVLFSRRWLTDYGLADHDIVGRSHYEVFPDIPERWRKLHQRVLAGSVERCEEDAFERADGSTVWIRWELLPWRDDDDEIGGLVMFTEVITERKRADLLAAGQRRLFELIAAGAALGDVLGEITGLVEAHSEGALCSILLIEDGRVRHGATPNLPPEYVTQIDGSAIGPSAGSCGTAAYRGESVIVADIETNPLWDDYRQLALPHGLRACWATPIFASDGQVVGTFANYYREPRSPDASDLGLIEMATGVASVAIERERSQAALRESEERFRSVFETTSTAIAITTVPDGTIMHVNRAFEQLVGRPEAELIGATVEAFTHPDELGRKKELFGELTRGERETSRFENRYVHPDGSVVWGDLTGSIVRDAEGRPAAYVGVITDVTDRKLAEEALRRRDAILEAVGWSAARLLQAGSLAETANEVLERLGRAAGTSRAYLFENHPGPAGTLLSSQRFEWVAEGISAQIDNAVLQNQPYPDEWRETMGAGVPFHRAISEFSGDTRTELEQQDILSLALVPIFVAEEWWGFVGFDECVTDRVWSAAELDALRAAAGILGAAVERARIEGAVRLATERLADVLEASPIATIAVDQEGRVTIWNAAAERVFGWTRGEVSGRPNPTVPPEMLEDVKALRRAVIEGKTPASIETKRRRKDGSLLEVRLSLGSMRDASGEVTGIVGLIEDISDLRRSENERRELEAQIQQTQKLEGLGVLAGGIAHDFNNLLMGMLGNAGLALLDLPEGTARERVLQVETAIQRAAELTHQLLAYAGKASFDVVALDLAGLVREMTHLLEVSIPKKVAPEPRRPDRGSPDRRRPHPDPAGRDEPDHERRRGHRRQGRRDRRARRHRRRRRRRARGGPRQSRARAGSLCLPGGRGHRLGHG